MSWTDVLLAALAGGAVLFVWGALCWIVLPHHHGDYRALSKADEEAVSRAIAATGATPGLYMLPHHRNYAGMKDPAFVDRYARGPNGTVLVTPAGPCMRGSTFLAGFALDVVAAFAAAVIWRYTTPAFDCLGKRVALFAGLGALVQGFPAVSQVIWTKLPVRNGLTLLLDGVVGFALLALTFEWLF